MTVRVCQLPQHQLHSLANNSAIRHIAAGTCRRELQCSPELWFVTCHYVEPPRLCFVIRQSFLFEYISVFRMFNCKLSAVYTNFNSDLSSHESFQCSLIPTFPKLFPQACKSTWSRQIKTASQTHTSIRTRTHFDFCRHLSRPQGGHRFLSASHHRA